jgi:hypothetical protein
MIPILQSQASGLFSTTITIGNNGIRFANRIRRLAEKVGHTAYGHFIRKPHALRRTL